MPDPGGNYNYRPGPLPAQHPPRTHPLRQGTMPNVNTGFIAPGLAGHLQPFGPQSAIQPQRPGSAAPYPIRPGSAGLGSHQPHRPSSAAGFGPLPRPIFGIPRANRSHSIAMGGGPPGIPPAGTYLTGPPRPFTSMNDSNTGRRPSGAGRQGYGPPPGHPPSSNGPDGAGYPGGYTGEAAPRVNTPKPHQHALDIGFEAPDPRPKPSKTAPPSGSIAPPPGGPPRPGTAQGRPGTGQGRPNTAQGPQSPIVKKPLPGTQHGGGQGSSEFFGQTNGPSSPPRAATQAARPVSAEAPPKPASTPLPKPPGKGPKTFEEMGVPQGPKNEQDCVGILITPQRISLTTMFLGYNVKQVTFSGFLYFCIFEPQSWLADGCVFNTGQIIFDQNASVILTAVR